MSADFDPDAFIRKVSERVEEKEGIPAEEFEATWRSLIEESMEETDD